MQTNYTDFFFRTSQYNGFVDGASEACASNVTDQCLLDPHAAHASGPVAGDCYQGSVSPAYIEIREPADVQAAFMFARRTGIPLSVKATGHDYQGRSGHKGSLGLWVRKLQKMEYHDSFVATGCPANKHTRAITVGAGVISDEVYAFAESYKSTFLSASASTVAVAGGWSLFGGHSVLSPLYGLGVDRVLEIKIVTADGVVRVANACTNQELFWALRGSGGSTYGVVLESTHRVEPVIPLTLALISFKGTSKNQLPFLSLLLDQSKKWASEGFGGPMSSSYIAVVNPRLNITATTASMAPAADYARAQGGTVSFESFPSYYAFYTKHVRSSNPGLGSFMLPTFHLLPKRLHDTKEGKSSILDFFSYVLSQGLTPIAFATTPNLYPYKQNSTSVSPGWRNSYWQTGTRMQWKWNSTLAERRTIAGALQNITARLTTLAGDDASYSNEADPWTQDWKHAFWGDNYPALLRIKKKYDPYNLLSCWKCVGFDAEALSADPADPAYLCMGLFQSQT